jgi:hypothetical protein
LANVKAVKLRSVNRQGINLYLNQEGKAMYSNPSKKKMARQENKSIKKAEKKETKAYNKIAKSTGLEFEQKAKRRHYNLLKNK